jgi:hypothetical protein
MKLRIDGGTNWTEKKSAEEKSAMLCTSTRSSAKRKLPCKGRPKRRRRRRQSTSERMSGEGNDEHTTTAKLDELRERRKCVIDAP